MERFVRTLRYLVNQNTARANAAEASTTLRQRRQEHEDVAEYLETQRRAEGGADG